MDKKNILYCGMADDILTPLIIEPNFSKLFVIDLFDSCYSSQGTFNSLMKDIKTHLKNGSNKDSKFVIDHVEKIQYLEDKCKIIEENIHIYPNLAVRWYLKFEYLELPRELIYYSEFNIKNKWPTDVTNISVIMCMGAYFGEYLIYTNNKIEEMIKTRTIMPLKFYASGHLYKSKKNKQKNDKKWAEKLQKISFRHVNDQIYKTTIFNKTKNELDKLIPSSSWIYEELP